MGLLKKCVPIHSISKQSRRSEDLGYIWCNTRLIPDIKVRSDWHVNDDGLNCFSLWKKKYVCDTAYLHNDEEI